jgi:regulatory protein
MNEITAITPQVKDKTRCNIYLDGRFCCGLALETAVKHRLKVGMIVTPEFLSEIQLESEKTTALDKALTHITGSQKTEREIRQFLEKKGYLPAVIEYVLEKMRDYRFVDDAQYARTFAQSGAKKKGARLLKMQLKGKGISDEDADAALGEIDGESQIAAATDLLKKYLRGKPLNRETLAKAYRYLLSKGFDYEVAKSALERLKLSFDEDL